MASNSETIISERFVLSRIESDWVAKSVSLVAELVVVKAYATCRALQRWSLPYFGMCEADAALSSSTASAGRRNPPLTAFVAAVFQRLTNWLCVV